MKKNKKNYVYIVLEYDILGQAVSYVVFSNKYKADKYHTRMCFENEYSSYFVHKVEVL